MEFKEHIELNPSEIVNPDFYNTVKDIVTCSICLGILIDPLSCNKCETSYCTKCLTNWKYNINIKNNLLCPMKCSQNKFNCPNRVLKNLLEKLEFSCKYGCNNTQKKNKVFNYDEIIKHLNNDCENIKINCTLCNSKVKYIEFKNSKYYLEVEKLKIDLKNQKDKNCILTQTVESLTNDINKLKEENIKKDKLIQKQNKERRGSSVQDKKSPNEISSKNTSNLSKKKTDKVSIHNNQYDLFDKCPHFKGNYIPIFNCCGKSYPCYICHQEANTHNMDISNKVICLYCKEIYSGNQCESCGAYQLYKKKFS